MIEIIAFDADDTLWHNESLYTITQERFARLLSSYRDSESIHQELYETEKRNLKLFGYGIKGFTLSMIETAIEITDGQICGEDIQTILDYSKEMLQASVKTLDHVEEVLGQLASSYPLMLISKGDLFDQETKLARSGLSDYFQTVEIVSEKTPAVYENILLKNDLQVDRFLMVGNSLRSDILPVLALGGQAVYIPYHTTWAHEVVEDELPPSPNYHELDHIGQLPGLLDELARG
jgi:putative hydrolase of the HAD superfamily